MVFEKKVHENTSSEKRFFLDIALPCNHALPEHNGVGIGYNVSSNNQKCTILIKNYS